MNHAFLLNEFSNFKNLFEVRKSLRIELVVGDSNLPLAEPSLRMRRVANSRRRNHEMKSRREESPGDCSKNTASQYPTV